MAVRGLAIYASVVNARRYIAITDPYQNRYADIVWKVTCYHHETGGYAGSLRLDRLTPINAEAKAAVRRCK